MPAVGQDVTIWQGDTHVLSFRVDDGNTPPAPVDLTGATGRWWAAKAANSTGSDIFIMKHTTDHNMSIVFDAGSGFWFVDVPINPVDTETIPKGKWYHECEVITMGGAVARVGLGKFIINQSLIPAALG
jgi:hypothetical protein